MTYFVVFRHKSLTTKKKTFLEKKKIATFSICYFKKLTILKLFSQKNFCLKKKKINEIKKVIINYNNALN
jgi:hypothetical protein